MATVLVTGGAGYIGSHTCRALAQGGHTPVTFDNLVTGHRWAVRYGPLVEADILDGAALRAALDRYKPDAVIHFAGLIAVGESVQVPLTYFEANVAGSISVFQAMVEKGVSNIVFSSTAAVYASGDGVTPLVETDTLAPESPYGRTKLTAEQMLADSKNAGWLRPTVLRYFNACGASPDSDIGEAHWPETHLIPLCLMAAAGDRPPLKLFGDDYPTPDGTCIRDYIHVLDLADAHVRAVESLLAGAEPVTCNVGTGTGISVREVIDAVGKITGKDVPYEIAPRRSGDVAALVADPTLIKDVLGWQARHSKGLDDIVSTAWNWYRHGRDNGLIPDGSQDLTR